VIAKPTVEDLGIDPDAQVWQRSGDGVGAIEIAFVRPAPGAPRGSRVPAALVVPEAIREAPVTAEAVSVSGAGISAGTARFPAVSGIDAASGNKGDSGTAEPGDADWILMRVTDDPDRRVLVFDRNEWECFLDGARNGEFDDAAGQPAS
jgi:hypothetical protein